MQSGVPQGRQIHQSGMTMSRLQRQGKIDGYGGCPASTFGIDHGKYFAARTFLLHSALRRRETDKGLKKIGGGGRTLDELARSCTHGADDDLRLIQGSNSKHGGFGQLLVQKFN